jgi:hypothetical protein
MLLAATPKTAGFCIFIDVLSFFSIVLSSFFVFFLSFYPQAWKMAVFEKQTGSSKTQAQVPL